MEFIPAFDIRSLKPADYNPRIITPEAFEKLKASLLRFGVVKPVIINGEKNVLTAGHQRTKAGRAVGISHFPAIRIPRISLKDEIRFNLFHNSVEEARSEVWIRDPGQVPERGFTHVAAMDVVAVHNAYPLVTYNIGQMLTKYGAWGSVVIGPDGRVLENAEYAFACKLLGVAVLAYRLPAEDVEDFKAAMRVNYGEYHFDALDLRNYNQTHCQMHRLTGGARDLKSSTYEDYVMRYLGTAHHAIDFGAGERAYAKRLKALGYDITAYEPYPKKDSKFQMHEVYQMLRDVLTGLKRGGLYDFVILDSVLNSVINARFEHLVLTTCNALCSADGVFITGTRASYLSENLHKHSRYVSKHVGLEFMDRDGFCVKFRAGVWTAQHFHTVETLKALLSRYFGKVEILGKSEVMVYARCSRPLKLAPEVYEEALNEEFNLEYPGGFRHNRHGELVSTLLGLIARR